MSISKATENFDSIDFTNLDEETETDGFSVDIVDMEIIQPHLSLPPPPSTTRRNQRERGVVTVDESDNGERTIHSSASGEHSAGVDSPDGDVTISRNFTKDTNEQAYDNNSNHVSVDQNGYTSGSSMSAAGESNNNVDNNDIDTRSPNDNGQTTTTTGTNNSSNPIQICYSKNTGNVSVREGQVSTVGPDGTRYISTQQIPQQWDDNERKPLRQKRIRWVKIFSIISCILFFPTGIPAAYFAFRVQREFEEGILRGNIDRAQKFATRSERLCILSIIMCILVAALVVTLIEKPQFQSEHYHAGTVTG